MRQSDATRRTTRRRFRRSVLAALALAGALAIPAAAEAQSVTITVDITGTGSGSVTSSPSGISCSGSNTNCTASFTSGTAITLTATADSGKTFVGWTGICSGTGTCQFNAAEGVLAVAPFSSPTAAAVTYYHHDAIGSVRALTDGSGTVVIRHDYFPFGEDTQPLTGDPLRFTGQEIDAESGQHHFQARQYRNIWGRFTTVDPGHVNGSLTDPQGWNGYAYARNNPLKFRDPDGRTYSKCLESCEEVSDVDFGRWAAGLGDEWRLNNGEIWNSGEVVGLYVQTSIDDPNAPLVGWFASPFSPGLGDLRTELFIGTATAFGLAGDDRPFDSGPNPNSSRFWFSLDFDTGQGFFQINPSCFSGGPCRGPLPIGPNGNQLSIVMSGDGLAMSGMLRNSAKIGPPIDFSMSIWLVGDGADFSGRRNSYPSWEITHNYTILDRQHEKTPMWLFDVMGSVPFSGSIRR